MPRERAIRTRCEKRGHHQYAPVAERTDPKSYQRKLVRLFRPQQIRALQTHRVCMDCGLEIKL